MLFRELTNSRPEYTLRVGGNGHQKGFTLGVAGIFNLICGFVAGPQP